MLQEITVTVLGLKFTQDHQYWGWGVWAPCCPGLQRSPSEGAWPADPRSAFSH